MPDADAFFFSDGQHAENIGSLVGVLTTASSEVTTHHITDEKNDYASWIRHFLGEEELARKVEKCRSVEQVVSVLKEHLDALTPVSHREQEEHHHEEQAHKKHHETQIKHEEHAVHHHEEEPQREKEEMSRAPIEGNKPSPPPLIRGVNKHKHAKDFVIGLIVGIVLAIIAYQLARLF